MNDQDAPGGQPGAPFIVGLGASPAAADSIEQFFSKFSLEPNIAVVIVVQQREALDEIGLRRSLRKLEGLQLLPVADGDSVEGGNVYLCQPGAITALRDGRFLVRRAEQAPGERGTIDSFLVSLAEQRTTEAIGVVLAGAGGDGTLGVSALKDRGGLAIAERTSEVVRSDHNTAAAIADFVLPVDEIADHISVYLRHLQRLAERRSFDEALAASGQHLNRIAEILRNKTGNDFHGYKQNTFLRRVQRRMQVVQVDDVAAYVEFLRTDKDEAQNLFNDLLIGVTQFFRDRKEFELLETEVIPRIFDGRSGQQVRVWVLGCATGEEAYSIGIMLREYMAKLDSPPTVQIFATDIDGRALAAARVGRYRASIENDVSPERLARWFVREGDTYCVVKELREMCIFSQHNVIKDAPFSRLDLISCRNLLIYLNADLQTRVIPLFHFALLPERFLFLGNSENITRHPNLFAPLDRRARIFRRLETGVRLPPEFPIVSGRVRSQLESPVSRPRASDAGLEGRAQRIVERYSPAYVITDEHFQILHFSGRTGRYIEPSPGAASLELLGLAHRDLRLELRSALGRALETNEPTHADQVRLDVGGQRLSVDITVEPIQDAPGGPRNLIVIFKDSVAKADGDMSDDGTSPKNEHVERLEAELRASRERLQATVEELESTNEELKSSNEEFQSLNEELQSANEELETSREELQSVNEELTTVNGELAHRVQELTRATSDLKNFLESTQIATVFLDNDLCVMNFTPAVTHILHLVETDVGRPISHIKARIPIEDLFDDVRQVLRTLSSVERRLIAPDSEERYIIRILPYRSVDNFIAGVVINFIDVTAITRAEERQQVLLSELQHRVRNTLGVVRGIVRRSAAGSASVAEYADRLDGRLAAFARTQALVTRNPNEGVRLDEIVGEELQAYRSPEGSQVEISGPAVQLRAKTAEILTLAFHELATNAAKYGALSTPRGRVTVLWEIQRTDGPSTLAIEWRESGGPPASLPTKRGFGSELLQSTLAYELDARIALNFVPAGVHCSIYIPVSNRILF